MSEAKPIETLPREVRINGTHVLIYFSIPSIWIVCKWEDQEDDYCWLAIGSADDRWSDEDAVLWAPVPQISNMGLMRIAAQELPE